MSVWSDIRSLLITRITSLGSAQAVYGYEEDHPSGWPTVFVTPANVEGSFVTTAENRRIYSYYVTVLFPTGQNVPKDSSLQKVEYAEKVISDVLEDIIDDIDENFTLDGVTILFVEAADAEWGFMPMEAGQAKACRITLRVHTDFEV